MDWMDLQAAEAPAGDASDASEATRRLVEGLNAPQKEAVLNIMLSFTCRAVTLSVYVLGSTSWLKEALVEFTLVDSFAAPEL
jgi:hypothetical protein